MEKLLEIREVMLEKYLKGERYFKPFGKFLAAIWVMMTINNRLGYNTQLKSWIFVIGISLISAFLPETFLLLFAAMVSVGHIFSASFVVAAAVMAIFMVLYVMLLRFVPKHAWAVAAIPVLTLYKLQFIVPITLGLIATPVSIVGAIVGVIVYYVLEVVRELIQVNGYAVNDYMNLYQSMIKEILENKEMIYTILIFSMIVLVVFIVRIQKMSYAFELSIGAGALTGLVGYLIMGLADGSILAAIFGSIASGIIVLVVWFFFLALDYTETEELQFQDDDYYYYVRAISKVKIEKKKKNIKKINEGIQE